MRYSTDIDQLFSPDSQSEAYEMVARAVYEAQRDCKVFDGPACPSVTVPVDRWAEIENEVQHETAAWVQAWREQLPGEVVPHTYLGMTSSNLIDCAFAVTASAVFDWFQFRMYEMEEALSAKIIELNGNLRAGRTHGQLAYPVNRDAVYRRTLSQLKGLLDPFHESLPLGGLSGPTGKPLSDVLGLDIKWNVEKRTSITIDLHATQVSSRIQLLRFAQSIYNISAVVEQLALFHRLESQSGIERFQEGFDSSRHKGSSSMPHKINPRRSERICGLARVNRGNLQAITETCSGLWWERDLSNSCVERTALRDLICHTAFMFQETIEVLESSSTPEGVEVMPDYVWDHKRLVRAQLLGEDPEQAYRELQARRLGGDHA